MTSRLPGTVHVVGSLNVDIVARVERHPRPGETVAASTLVRLPGGKGLNQAVAAARAGAAVRIIGAIGNDDDGRDLRAVLTDEGIDASGVATVEGPTGTALISVDHAGENSIVVVAGANSQVDPASAIPPGLVAGDVVVSQLEVPLSAVAAAMGSAVAAGAVALLNAAPAAVLPDDLLRLVDVLVVNEIEAEDLGGAPRVVGRLRPGGAVIVTLGPDGALIVTESGAVKIEGSRADVVDTTGAGDCVVGVVAAQLAIGSSLVDAARVATVAGALAVQRVGAALAMPTAAEIAAAT